MLHCTAKHLPGPLLPPQGAILSICLPGFLIQQHDQHYSAASRSHSADGRRLDTCCPNACTPCTACQSDRPCCCSWRLGVAGPLCERLDRLKGPSVHWAGPVLLDGSLVSGHLHATSSSRHADSLSSSAARGITAAGDAPRSCHAH
jgi:hypothetical protein